MRAKNFAGAIGVALLLVLPAVVPTIGRIDTWKIELGLAGLAIFASAGLAKSS